MADYVCVWVAEASDKKSHRAMRSILRIIDFEFVERAVIDRNHAETGVHSLSL